MPIIKSPVPFGRFPVLQINLLKLLSLIAVLLLASPFDSNVQAAQEPVSGTAIQEELRRFREMGSVLYIAAHPDDENTQLITYLARGRGYRTAYLSLTRGDGGQNVIGGEFGAQLGMIRTQELLAARRLDGAKQFFTRALDFGFSKDYQETLNIWDHQQVLADVVRVIRIFRPDVMITRFSTQPGGTHGHHTASAVLALEAFKLAGDAKAFPEQFPQLKPWQPKRILMNGRGNGALQMDISGVDPVLGQPFSKIAERSRAMHISQGFGDFKGGEARAETFQILEGEPATKDILEGVDTTWNRVPGGGDVARLASEATAAFNPDKPADSVPALLQLHARLQALPDDPLINEKRRDLDRIIQHCVALTVETIVPQAEVVSGETLILQHRAVTRSTVPVQWVTVQSLVSGVSMPAENLGQDKGIRQLKPGQVETRDAAPILPAETPLSQPYWLRQEATAGMARVAESQLIGQPENAPPVGVRYVFSIGGQQIIVEDEPVQIVADPAKGETRRRSVPAKIETRRRLVVVAPVALHLTSDVRLFAPGATRPVNVEVLAARDNTAGLLVLEAPAGWKVEPVSQPFRIAAAKERMKLTFNVTAPNQTELNQASAANITARATVNGKQFDTQRIEINYPHIPPLLDQSPARFKAVVLDLAIRGREVGYLPGAGDSVANALEEMGYNVTLLTGADLTAERLKRLDAVVIGVRAFNVRSDLENSLDGLFAYVEGGGNVIAQYNRPNDLKIQKIAPYDLTLSGLRVTNENAPVTFLVPEHPALNTPNKITQKDFEGWVQERGIYYPNQWDAHFTPLLSMGDPGEEVLKGGLLIAPYGRGNFVYTGLVFFRQLPAGVPGAYRLLANLVSLSK